jgi:hypothetical protein
VLHLLVSVASTTAYGCQVGPGDGLGMQPTASVGKNLGWGGVGCKGFLGTPGGDEHIPNGGESGQSQPHPHPLQHTCSSLGEEP